MQAEKSDCTEWDLLLQADLDGELDAATAARVARHMAQCSRCASLQKNMHQLHQMLSQEISDSSFCKKPGQAFRNGLRERIAVEVRESLSVEAPTLRFLESVKKYSRFAMSMTLVCAMLIAFGLTRFFSENDLFKPGLSETILNEHIRSLQAEHLLDIASSDRHSHYPPPAILTENE